MARTYSENAIRRERTWPDHSNHRQLAAPISSPLVKTLERPTTRRAKEEILVIVRTRLWEDGASYGPGDIMYCTRERARQLAGYPGYPQSRLVLIPEPEITRSRIRKEIGQMPTLNDPKANPNGDTLIEIIPEKRSPRFTVRELGGVLKIHYHCVCGSVTTSSGPVERCATCGHRP
jgi:hypothetical protein